ncbi:MAG: phage integrase N-terminal SAM-like domain-containing protein [Acidimicrobiales bacterium]|nr:phage integrase N-terminal SAM-like domain-containing protein [Acidimicrobiales bacterium]
MPPDPNAALLSSWELSLHAKSPGTRKLYLRTANWFIDWLKANARPAGGVGDLLEVTRQDAEAWFGAMREAGRAPTTIRSRWIALRNLFAWLTDEEEVESNPLSKVKVAKPNPDPIRVLSDDDLRALLKACEGRDFLDRLTDRCCSARRRPTTWRVGSPLLRSGTAASAQPHRQR